MEQSDWQSFPQISHQLQKLLPSGEYQIDKLLPFGDIYHENNGCCICSRDTCSKTDVWVRSNIESEERLLCFD